MNTSTNNTVDHTLDIRRAIKRGHPDADWMLVFLRVNNMNVNENNTTTISSDDEPDGFWQDCWNCGGEGYSHHDCGEDTCCCLYPQDNVRCDVCDGNGGWYVK